VNPSTESERHFALPTVGLKEIVRLDSSELLPKESSIKIQDHDLPGPLPPVATVLADL